MTSRRLERIETEIQFRLWLRRARMHAEMTVEELETLAMTGQWPNRPEPPFGSSRFDSMDRPSLTRLCKEDLEAFVGRSSDELEFYALHGHWPNE